MLRSMRCKSPQQKSNGHVANESTWTYSVAQGLALPYKQKSQDALGKDSQREYTLAHEAT